MAALLCSLLFVATNLAEELLFSDPFKGRLQDGWRWVRQDPTGWRMTPDHLEIRVLPGNMWGPENSARNLLVRALPDPEAHPVQLTVTVENRPTEQYEQVDLVWYYDDSHMVKLGQELVDGQLSIVMGREEGDRTRTIAIIPLQTAKVQLRLTARGRRIVGHFRPGAQGEWKRAGESDLPVKGDPHAALQCYQGPATAEHWAKISRFTVKKPAASALPADSKAD